MCGDCSDQSNSIRDFFVTCPGCELACNSRAVEWTHYFFLLSEEGIGTSYEDPIDSCLWPQLSPIRRGKGEPFYKSPWSYMTRSSTVSSTHHPLLGSKFPIGGIITDQQSKRI